ncbi:uncharacterized protein IUM83_14815 [Phytophthora cinnamomi]|uniref:uncharacterized protein n=1 Tax=Phytophthora cinnamomi TaxID=4785 RepID=UPI00355A5157|nr:hypothetical protein IUM83_14815 [Phytophthora cinnamomi]
MAPQHPWQLLASATPRSEGDALLAELKKYRVDKSDLTPCLICMLPAPHTMRVQRLICACKACADISRGSACSWRARVMTCQVQGLMTIEDAYTHCTPARAPRKPVLTRAMKEIVMDWAAQGLKPKRIYNALLPRFNLTESTAPSVASVQRFAHYHVTGRLGGSDLLDAVRQKIKDRGFTCHEEEAAAFTFTSRSDRDGKPITGNGSDSDPFVVGISSKKLLRRADRDPESFIFHLDATYKLTQVGYPVVVVGISDRARRFHLVAIFIVSQQQQQNFAEILGMLAHTYMSVTGKPLRVRYVMGDADAAQWSAVNDVFGEECNYMFLMCYFHVAKKVFEKTRSLPPAMAASVMEAIHKMHFAASESAYLKVLVEAQENWSKLPELKRFSQYFSKVWLNQRFWRWQCFHTPSGFATTNNPCETYNAMIKRDVTLRRKLKTRFADEPLKIYLLPRS